MRTVSLRQRRAIGGSVAGATVAAIVLAGGLAPMSAVALAAANPADPSAAQGQIIQLPAALLGGIDIASLGHTLTSNPSAAGPETGSLNLGVLNALNIDVGTLNVPLLTDGVAPGLLELGDLGVAQSFSSSPSQTQSTAASGKLTAGGAIDVGGIDSSVDPANLNLTSLLDQLGLAGVTSGIVDQASLQIGALASRASKVAATTTSEYRISDLGLKLHSQLVGDLAGDLGAAIQGTVAPVSALGGPGGALTTLANTVTSTLEGLSLSAAGIPVIGVDATGSTVSIAGINTVGDTVATQLLAQPIENDTNSVRIDLSTGTISVDLAKILVETGAGVDLNSLAANTSVLSATTINAIQQGITSALTGTHPNSLVSKTKTLLTAALNALTASIVVNVDLTAPIVGSVATGNVTVSGTLAQFAGTNPTPPTTTTSLSLVGLNLGTILTPVLNAVTGAISGTTGPLVSTALTNVVPLVQPALAGLTTPLTAALDPVLQAVLDGVADVTINEQPTKAPTNAATGDLPGGSFTVRALGVNLLPGVGGGVALDLASSTVKALDVAPTVDAAPTVVAGQNLSVDGANFTPDATVTLVLTGPGGAPTQVGTPVTVTADGLGNIPIGTVYPVPFGTTPGTFTLTATDTSGKTATDTTVVTAPLATVDAAPTVPAGTNLGVTGSGWAPNSTVSLQLTAPGGAAVGGPVVLPTDASGQIAGDYPIPGATPAALGYLLTATQGATTATDTTEVTAAPDPGDANTNAAASASASADATANGDPSAQAAAVAAAFADASSNATAAADATANAAAESAALTSASTNASTTSTSAANAQAAAAAQAAAQADASDDTNAAASTAANANSSASSNAAATATSSANASSEASTNANAAASASASANADASADAVADPAAQAAAFADATSQASADANADAVAAAQTAANATASTTATASATSAANANAAVAAQAAALANASSNANATASAAANANASSAAEAAALANSSTDASVAAVGSASASATAAANADPSGSASADAHGGIGITLQHPTLYHNEQQTAVGTGFQPGEVVTGVMHSTPHQLGTQIANVQGTVTFTWVVDEEHELGLHTVTLTGNLSGSVSATFQIIPRGLAGTGADVPGGWIVLGVMLLMLALGAALVARSRRAATAAE